MEKNRFLPALAFALSLIAVATSCDPDKKQQVGDLNSLFEALATPLEKTSFDAGQAFVFSSQSGKTTVVLPASSLLDEAGNQVSGMVDLEFQEIYTKGGMMLNRRPTQTADGRGIESGGEMYLGLSQNGKPLQLKPGQRVNILMKTDDPVYNMDVFYGTTNPENGQFAWEDDGTPAAPNVAVAFDSSNIESYGYEFFSDRLDWINCDRFYGLNDDQLSDICAVLPEGYDLSNTTVYVVFNNLNSVMSLWYPSNGDFTFCNENVPVGEEVTIISVSAIGPEGEEVYFLAHETATVVDGLEVEMTPVETSLSDIEAYLGGF